MTDWLIQITSGVWSWGKFTDAKKGGDLGACSARKFWKPSLRLAKNAFAIQQLLHHSIIYTFIHHPTNFVLLRWTCISEVIPAVQVAFFLLVRVFPLNLSFYLNFYNYIFLSWGNIFWELKTFSGTNGPVVRYFFQPWWMRSVILSIRHSISLVQFIRPWRRMLEASSRTKTKTREKMATQQTKCRQSNVRFCLMQQILKCVRRSQWFLVSWCWCIKDAVQSVCKQRLCLHYGIQNIEFYWTTIFIFSWF
jgi:hypothetical protein